MWPLISVGASCLLLLVALTTEPVDAFGVCNCPSINRDGQASPSNGFLVLEKTTAPHRTARILHFESVESDPSVFIDFGHCLIDPEGLVFRSDSNGIHVLVADHNRILDASPAGLRTVARLPLDRIVALSSDFEGIRVWGLTSGQRRLFSVDPRSGELRFEAKHFLREFEVLDLALGRDDTLLALVAAPPRVLVLRHDWSNIERQIPIAVSFSPTALGVDRGSARIFVAGRSERGTEIAPIEASDVQASVRQLHHR